jgi:hypothetical protein
MSKVIAKKEIFSATGYVVEQSRPELDGEQRAYGSWATKLRVVDLAGQEHVFLANRTKWLKDKEFLEMNTQSVRVTVTLEVLEEG